ncbi:MAG: DNA-processing protein DprA [Patescibacteria group bacterium]
MATETQDRDFWLALSFVLAPIQIRKLARYLPSGEAAWRASRETLRGLNFEHETIEKFFTYRTTNDSTTTQEKLRRENIEFVIKTDSTYPALLKEIPDAPHLFFYRGVLPLNKPVEPTIAIVGTRKMTEYGKVAALHLTQALAKNELTTVSGLARGIDAIVHEATLEVGGRTIAVLGSSIAESDIYPPEHRQLATKIVESGGLLMSEYPPGVGPSQHHFPERNRIIAGLSLGTLVIEAPLKSGALITARLALDYNREILAIPGRITEENAAGCNALLHDGAHVITGAQDVFVALGLEPRVAPTKKLNQQLSATATNIMAALSHEPIYFDDLAARCSLSTTILATELLSLELSGLVRDVGGKRYIKL